MSNNVVTLVGNVVDSPRLTRLPSGMVANFRMASSTRRFDTSRQEFVDGQTLWIDIACWNELGGNVVRSISKGDPVIVQGTLYTDSWETENGRRNTTRIRATVVGPNLKGGFCDFHRPQRSSPAPEPGTAAPAGLPEAVEGAPPATDADPGFGDLDYEVASEALGEVDPDPDSEPALT
jgi:single-strand DNA-binding protein